VSDRSAAWTVDVAVAVLLPVVLSFGEDTVALFVFEPVVVGETVMVMFGVSAPEARLPPVRLHVTVPDAFEHVQLLGAVALTKFVPAGSVSTTFTADASSGPSLCTPIV
jgi:hypothetical protein